MYSTWKADCPRLSNLLSILWGRYLWPKPGRARLMCVAVGIPSKWRVLKTSILRHQNINFTFGHGRSLDNKSIQSFNHSEIDIIMILSCVLKKIMKKEKKKNLYLRFKASQMLSYQLDTERHSQ